jgi:hypothetical protein
VSGTVTAGSFVGDGSLITGVVSTDNTKLPIAGGTMTGTLNTLDVSVGGIISGNGSGLTNLNDTTKLPKAGGTMTGTLNTLDVSVGGVISGNGSGLTGVTDAGALPKAGGTMTGTLVTQGITIGGGYTITGSGAGLTSVNDVSKVPLIGDSLITGNLTVQSGNITLAAPGYFVGSGSGLTGVTGTDNTKLPTAGGTMTGLLTTQNVSVLGVISGNGSGLTGVLDTTKLPNACCAGYSILNNTPPPTQTRYTVPASNVKFLTVYLTATGNCKIALVNLVTTNATYFPDGIRFVTIVKQECYTLDYLAVVEAPGGYVFKSIQGNTLTNYNINIGTSSCMFMITNVNTVLPIANV